MKDLVAHHSTNTPVDTGQKFCKLYSLSSNSKEFVGFGLVVVYSLAKYELGYVSAIFSSKKKEKARPHFIPDLCQRGAILWQVMLDDSGQGQQVECFLGLMIKNL